MFTLISHLKTLGTRGEPEYPPELTVGRDVTMQGLFTCDGFVRVEGRLQGEVRCKELLVSHQGIVEGRVVADHVVVHGIVRGDIYAQFIELMADSNVEGEIYHAELHLEPGSWFEGKSRRHADALALAPAQPASEF